MYEHGEADPFLGLASGDAEMIHAGVSYTLGAGVSVGASVGVGEDDSDGGPDKDYTTFTTGVVVSF